MRSATACTFLRKKPPGQGASWRQWVLAVACSFFASSGCGRGATANGRSGGGIGSAAFTVAVRGTKADLEAFDIAAPGLDTRASLIFSGSALFRVLETNADWGAIAGRSYEVSATSAGVELGRVVVKPYICQQNADFSARIANGWKAREVHEIHLMPDGSLDSVTDFTMPLHFSCEWTSPSGDGDGSASIFSSMPLCSDPDRSGTDVVLVGQVSGVSVDTKADICYAVLDDRSDGVLNLAFLATTDFGQITLSTAHCLSGKQGANESLPALLESLSDAVDCKLSTTLEILDAAGLRAWHASLGHWLIESAGFLKGDRTRGAVSFSFDLSSTESLTASGAVDLPIVRVPIEYDWKDP